MKFHERGVIRQLNGDLVYPWRIYLDIDVLPVPVLEVEELDVTEEPKEEVKPVDEVVTEEPVLFDWDKWEPKLSKEETDILLNKVVSSDFNPSTDVLFKLSSSGPKEIDDYLHDNFLYLLEDSPKPELVEEEPKEEAKPVRWFWWGSFRRWNYYWYKSIVRGMEKRSEEYKTEEKRRLKKLR